MFFNVKGMSDQSNSFARLWEQIKDYAVMRFEYCKLTAAEKVSMLITALSLALLIGTLCAVALFFISMAAVYWIAIGVGYGFALLIMAGVYALAVAVVVIFRRQLILNPVCRFISRLLLS